MRKRLLKIVIISLILFLLIGIIYKTVSRPRPPQNTIFDAAIPGLKYIKRQNLVKIITKLCQPEFTGRLAGTDGFNQAANYVAGWFADIGLEPALNNSYFQYFQVESNKIIEPVNFKIVSATGEKYEYQLGQDFLCRGFSGNGHISAPVVFCGYGISAAKNHYDDYAKVDVKDKIVMIFKPAPDWHPADKNWGNSAFPRVKAEMATQRGAVGMILVALPNNKRQQQPIGSVYHGPGEQHQNFPQIHITLEAARDMLRETGKSLSAIQNRIDTTRQPLSFALPVKAEIQVTAKYRPSATTMNIVGILEGSDPELKSEAMLLTAHLDHVGQQGKNVYFPGANDNASGIACLLQVAKAFVKSGVRPKRSLVFIAYAAEEMGLDGSRFYAEHPVIPLNQTVAQLNVDCVGLGDSIQVNGREDFPDLHQIAELADDAFIHWKNSRSGRGGGADAQPLFEKGIPTLYFVTTNCYRHLHLPGDTAKTIKAPILEATAKLLYLTGWAVAERDKAFKI